MIKTKEWLIESRQKAGLTQQQLADRSGVSVHAIRNIEQGTREGSSETWKALITALENRTYTLVEVIEELKGYKIEYQTIYGIIGGLKYDDFSRLHDDFFAITIFRNDDNLQFYVNLNKELMFIKKSDVNYKEFTSFNNKEIITFCDSDARTAHSLKKLGM